VAGSILTARFAVRTWPPGSSQTCDTRRPAINPRTIAITFVTGGALTISGGLLATGFLGGNDAASDSPVTASGLYGDSGSTAGGELNPPPGAPLDRSSGGDSSSPGAASLLPSPTPTKAATSSNDNASPTATKKPASSASSGESVLEPTATKKPSNSTAAAAATNPPATATKGPATSVPTTVPTAAPTATTAPTLAPTQVPTQVPTQAPTQAPTQPPAPTATKTPAPTATPTTPPPPPQSVSLHPMEAEMFADHNQERASNGLAPLAIDAQLVQVARQRSQTMADTNCFSHTACGPTAFQLLGAIPYFYQIAGENIARNNYPDSVTVQVAMYGDPINTGGFMNSAGHRANILESRYTKVGIGVAFGAGGMKYFTVVFAGP
jgi:uncharacterized protein YkwD